MAAKPRSERSLGETVNTWVQTVGICIAAAWGVYTFVYEKITIPKSAPVNVTLNLDLKKIEAGATSAGLIAVEMKASATNPSSRRVYLLPSAWVAYGVSMTAAENDDRALDEKALKALRDVGSISTVQRHAKQTGSSIVAVGRLFFDNALEPGETLVRKVIFYVPREKYDLLNVVSLMPNTSADIGQIDFEWSINGNLPEGAAYRLDRNGKRIPEKGTETGYSTAPVDITEANTQISLWSETTGNKM